MAFYKVSKDSLKSEFVAAITVSTSLGHLFETVRAEVADLK